LCLSGDGVVEEILGGASPEPTREETSKSKRHPPGGLKEISPSIRTTVWHPAWTDLKLANGQVAVSSPNDALPTEPRGASHPRGRGLAPFFYFIFW